MQTFDLQVNGYLGIDFSSSDLTETAFRDACCDYLEFGASRFLPTMITSSMSRFERNLQIIARVMAEPQFSDLMPGIHLEGPFISPKPGAVGAHCPDHVLAPNCDILERLQEWAGGKIRLLTIAAELPGAVDLCREAVATGMTVALGHQLASRDDLCRLADAGATALTHLGNAMPKLVNRHDNPLINGLAATELVAMIIPDGHHLPDHVLELILEVKGPRKTIAVSDASPLAGMPPGRYRTLGNDVILEADGRLHNPTVQCLVGSSSTLSDCIPVLQRLGLDASDVETMVRYNPQSLIGIAPELVPPKPCSRIRRSMQSSCAAPTPPMAP